MPRYLDPVAITNLSKVTWRIDLVLIELPTKADSVDRNVYLTDHYQDIVVTPANLEPNIARNDNYIFKATSGLLGVGSVVDDLEAKDAPLNISLNGIRREFVATILAEKIKGSRVALYRAFFDQETGGLFGKPIKRWVGRVDAVSITDSSNIEQNQENIVSISVDCRSIISLIKERQSGLYTSESSWNKEYPLDTSMHNIAGLVDREFNFGKKE